MDSNKISMFGNYDDYADNGLKKQLFSNLIIDATSIYAYDNHNTDNTLGYNSESNAFVPEKASKLWNHINSRSYMTDSRPHLNESNQPVNDPSRLYNISRVKIDEDQDKIEVISDIFSENDDMLNRLASLNRSSNTINYNSRANNIAPNTSNFINNLMNNTSKNSNVNAVSNANLNATNTITTSVFGNISNSNTSSIVNNVNVQVMDANDDERPYVEDKFSTSNTDYLGTTLNHMESSFLDSIYIDDNYTDAANMESANHMESSLEAENKRMHSDLNSVTTSDSVKHPGISRTKSTLVGNTNESTTPISSSASVSYPQQNQIHMNMLDRISSVDQLSSIEKASVESAHKLNQMDVGTAVDVKVNVMSDNNPFDSKSMSAINRNSMPPQSNFAGNHLNTNQLGYSRMSSTNNFNTHNSLSGTATAENYTRSVGNMAGNSGHTTYTRPINMAANLAGYGRGMNSHGANYHVILSYSNYVDYNPFSIFSINPNTLGNNSQASINESELRKLKSIILNNTHSEETMVKYFTEAICITNSQMMTQIIKFFVSLIPENHKIRQFIVRLLLCALSFHPEEFVNAFKVEYLSVLFIPQIDDSIGVHFLKLLLSYKSTFHSLTEVNKNVPVSVNSDGYLVYPGVGDTSVSASVFDTTAVTPNAIESGVKRNSGQQSVEGDMRGMEDYKDGKIETLYMLKILTERNKVTSVYDLFNSSLREQLCIIWYEMPNTIPNVNIIEILLHWIDSKEDLDTKKYPFLLLEKIRDLNHYPIGHTLLLSQFFLFAIKHKANIHHHLEYLITLASSHGSDEVLSGVMGNRLIGVPNPPVVNRLHPSLRSATRIGTNRFGSNIFSEGMKDRNQDVLGMILFKMLFTFNEKDLLDLWCLLCVIPWKVTSPTSAFSNLFLTTLMTILKVTSLGSSAPGGHNGLGTSAYNSYNSGYMSNGYNDIGYDNYRDHGYMVTSVDYNCNFRGDGKVRLDILENCLRIALVRCSCPVNSLNALLQTTLLLNPSCMAVNVNDAAGNSGMTAMNENVVITCLNKNGMILSSLCSFLWKCHFLWTRIKEGVNIEIVIVVTELYKILSHYTNVKPLDTNHEYNLDSNKIYSFFSSYSGNGLWSKITTFIPQINLDHYMEHINHHNSAFGTHSYLGVRGATSWDSRQGTRATFPFMDRPQHGDYMGTKTPNYGPTASNGMNMTNNYNENWRTHEHSYVARDDNDYMNNRNFVLSKHMNKMDYVPSRVVIDDISNRVMGYKQPVIGLKNLGNSCYMNSLLQSLYHTRLFVHNLLLTYNNPTMMNRLQSVNGASRNGISGNKTQMINALVNLFNKMRSTNKKSVSPKNIFKLFSDNLSKSQQDVTEAIRFISEALDPDLELWKSVFAGLVVRRIKCLRCETISDNEETMYDFSLTLNKAKTVQQMLDNFCEVEVLSGENKYFCLVCNKDVKAKMWNEIASPPSHLIIILNRNLWSSNETQKLLKRVKIDSELTITGFQYRLYGSIIHVGDSTESGHYYYIGCDSENTSDWNKIDDSTVTKLDEFAVDEISRESNSHVPYVLYYRCIQAPPTPAF